MVGIWGYTNVILGSYNPGGGGIGVVIEEWDTDELFKLSYSAAFLVGLNSLKFFLRDFFIFASARAGGSFQ